MATDDLTYREVFGEEVDWKPNAPVTFWLARHGVSEYNLEDRIGGDSNITPTGQIFADTLPSLFGRVLRESGDDHRFISVWTSTLIRTIQTASKLPLPQIHLKELDEINAGVCDGATYEYIKKYMPYIHYNRKKDKLGYRYPSGESYIDLCKRVWPIVRQLKAHGGNKLIVGHQAVLRCMFGYLEGRPMKDITHLSVPHHQIFQFTVYPDGTITRKDFHMDLVRDPQNPSKPIPGWPFDVSHSRPLTATDIARYSPKPLVPLLINRVVSLSDAPPASSSTVDPNSQGVPPPGLQPVLPDPDTCAAVAADQSSASTTNSAPLCIRGTRLVTAVSGTECPTAEVESRRQQTSRLKTATDRRLLSSKSHMSTMPGRSAPGCKATHGPERLHSAPGDLLSFLETYRQSSQPFKLEDLIEAPAAADVEHPEPFSAFGAASRGAQSSLVRDSSSTCEGSLGVCPDAHGHSHVQSAPCLPEHRGGSPAPCSIPEKCGSLLSQDHPSRLSSEYQISSFPAPVGAKVLSNAPTTAVPLHSASSSLSSAFAPRSLFLQHQPASGSCSAAGSRTRSGDVIPPSLALPSKDNSPLKQVLDASTHLNSNSNSAQNIPPEVRCMACGAMVPVHPKPCDIKPSRLNSGNVQNVLASYLPEGITSSMTLSSYANESCPNSKQASYTIGSAFDFDDAVPQLNQPMPPGACSLQNLPEVVHSKLPEAGIPALPGTVPALSPSASGTVTPSVAIATPSATSPSVEAASAAAERVISTGVSTPQLELREAVVHSTGGTRLSPLDTGSGDPGAEYPGSPCAPYPLIATPQHQRAMSELALAFQELRARGSYSNNGSGTGGAGSSLTEGGGTAPRSGRLSLPRGAQRQATRAPVDSFVAEDPCLRAEELRRKLEDSQGFHFRGEACRLVESGLRDREMSREEQPSHDPDMHQPADLAW